MVAASLESLLGAEPDDAALAAALGAIGPDVLEAALRELAREHGDRALPLLRRSLAGPHGWAQAAAAALGGLRTAGAAEALRAAERAAGNKPTRTAIRRALYRLRQAGVAAPAPAPLPSPPPTSLRPRAAWTSAVDGNGIRGIWLVLEGPFAERTLVAAVLSDQTGLLDVASGPIAKKRLDERLRERRAESGAPWVAAPPEWAAARLQAARSGREATPGLTEKLARAIERMPAPAAEAGFPALEQVPEASVAADAALLDEGRDLLALPELASWVLESEGLRTDAVDLIQARESRLVVSDRVKAEREAAIVDRAIDRELTGPARQRWRDRLLDTAWVLIQTARPREARQAVATAAALGDPERAARHVPLVRGLVERSLAVAGEVVLGRLPADRARRPLRPGAPATP